MRRALSSVCAASIVAALLAMTPLQPAQSAPDPDDAEASLRSDADGSVVVRKDGGVVTFAGASAGTEVDNPAVDGGESVSVAARAHLQRYGSAFGTDRPGTTLVESRRGRVVTGAAVVRYQQRVGGVPVIGGDVVVVLADDKDLSSVNANLSEVRSVPAATVSESRARRTAINRVRRSTGGQPNAAPGDRWLWDPAAIGRASSTGPRGVWRFEVRDEGAVRHQVLIDDRTGDVVLDIDLVQHVDRVVCDKENGRVTSTSACTTGFARTEDPTSASEVTDVEQAFHNAGATAELYEDILEDFDLTNFIGLDTNSGRKLASTVRICVAGEACPYENAYWNGRQMFYGAGYAAADDVVGHEMTHGVIERSSDLLYLDQSGAINESLADIVGEIVDHRNVVADEQVTWTAGEDLPGDALRSFADPTTSGQPDRMTSSAWAVDSRYEDNGGVHTNSGVGNKAFHLVSQGGTFNGQTVTGIDVGDPTLERSARLWIQTLQSLTSFSEYADLADVLEQSCASLVGEAGFTPAHCTAVQQVITATEMRQDPTTDPFADAERTCPSGHHAVRLFDSEPGTTSDQESLFVAGAGWGRTPNTDVNRAWGVHAFSDDTAWVAQDPPTRQTNSLTVTTGIAIPSGQPTYLAFRHWWVTDFDTPPGGTVRYWDGGTAAVVDGDGTVASLATKPWVNGPTRTLQPVSSGVRAFAGSSRGWVGSRVDLTDFAGQMVKPHFTMRSDDDLGAPGWYLDDIVVYTCFSSLEVLTPPTIDLAVPRVGAPLTVSSGTWNVPDATYSYQWYRSGVAIGGATNRRYTVVAADRGKRLSAQVTARATDLMGSAVALTSAPVNFGYIRAPREVKVLGTPRVGKVLVARYTAWSPRGVTVGYRWLRDGRPIAGANRQRYLLRTADRGHRMSVQVTGTKPGYASRSRRSASTTRVLR